MPEQTAGGTSVFSGPPCLALPPSTAATVQASDPTRTAASGTCPHRDSLQAVRRGTDVPARQCACSPVVPDGTASGAPSGPRSWAGDGIFSRTSKTLKPPRPPWTATSHTQAGSHSFGLPTHRALGVRLADFVCPAMARMGSRVVQQRARGIRRTDDSIDQPGGIPALVFPLTVLDQRRSAHKALHADLPFQQGNFHSIQPRSSSEARARTRTRARCFRWHRLFQLTPG